MRQLLWLAWMMGLLHGCASTPSTRSVDNIEQYFLDNHFKSIILPVVPAQLFALSPQTTQVLQQAYQSSQASRTATMAHRWLANYISASQGGFSYQDNITRIPQQTFEDRAGNCMSLVLLTTAMADALGVAVEFQQIAVPPVWDKQGQFYLINGHINLRLLPQATKDTVLVASQEIQIDFLPERTMRSYAKSRIDKTTVMAMFYNNVAAESLVAGDYDLAYQYSKQSLRLRADFIPALNTLAILYRYKGLDDAAETLYKLALTLDDDDMNVLYNYALLLESQQRLVEWAQLHKTLELARISNPYYYYNMGQQAYMDHEYQRALTWYKRAVEKADYRHEFYFGLSRVYWVTGDTRNARKHLEKALSLSTDAANQRRYQAKLQAMQSH